MLKIVSGSVDKVKAEMKQHASSLTFEIKSIKKLYNEKAKEMNKKSKDGEPVFEEKRTLDSYQKKMDELGKKKQFYSSSIVPVKVDGVIINFKAYEDFMKKLAGFKTDVIVEQDKLTLHYWKGPVLGAKPTGRLELYDLSKHFLDFSNVPVAEIDEVESYGA